MTENDVAPNLFAQENPGSTKPQINPKGLAVLAVIAALVAFVALRGNDNSSTANGGASTTVAGDGTTSLPATLLDVALQFHNEGRLEDAVRAYKAVLATDPTNKFAFYNLGVIAQDKKDYAEAIVNYDKTLALDEAFNPARYNRGLAYRDSNQVDKAIADLRAVIAADKTNASAMYNLGQMLISQGNSAEGSQLVTDAVEMNPQLAAG